MKTIKPGQLKDWLALAFAGLTIGCAGAVDGIEQGGATEDGVADTAHVATAALERRLVDRAYPYSLGADAVVCADWEIVAPGGEVVDVQREWYPMATMNRHLANVGTSEAVAHVNEEFRDALADAGIRRIDTCDQAREYVRLGNLRLGMTATPANDAAAAEPDVEDDQELQDKILNGSSFDHLSTVGIQTTGGTCTANLIGPFSMLTSGNCIPATGFIALRAWIQLQGQAQKCISHPGGGTCPALGAANVYAARHPSFDGTAAFDQAVVIINPGWHAPANVSSRWTRFAANSGFAMYAKEMASPLRIAGYGIDGIGGASGVDRRGNSTHTINSASAPGNIFTIKRLTAASSAICVGDAGSGPYNTTLIGSNLLMGITWGSTGPNCPEVGGTSTHSMPDGNWIKSVVTFFGGTCTTSTALNAPYVRCW